MMVKTYVQDWLSRNRTTMMYRTTWQRLHIDLPLLVFVSTLTIAGLLILYSASGQSTDVIARQGMRIVGGFSLMFLFAQISPQNYQRIAPWFYVLSILLLITVLITGHIGKGAQRWLNLGLVRFQPSELIKLALPMMMAWYLHNKPLPPSTKHLLIAALLIIFPVILTAEQPDLSTAILITSGGGFVLFLAGISWRLLVTVGLGIAGGLPFLWHYMHDYQRQRVLTFLNPERDPLRTGYHIIQSKIAIGSGGVFGKGWLAGTQAHLQFLPEHATDFIFAVVGEELGLIGSILLLVVYLCIVGRGLIICYEAQDTFTRLLAGSIIMMFFTSVFVNAGMVTGILPVAGVPLPLVSYGGSSIMTVLASFGILMSIHCHKKLVRT